MSKLKFKVGDKVNFILVDSILFTGVIIVAEKKRGLKPYVIDTPEGKKYSHECFLSLATPVTN